MTIWDQVLERLRSAISAEEYRRWFIATAYASDSGDQITVWVPTESVRRHIARNYHDEIDEALAALGRSDTQVRLVVGGLDEDDDEIDE